MWWTWGNFNWKCCGEVLKAVYLNNSNNFANEALEEYLTVKAKDVTCTDSEKTAILNEFKNYISKQRVPDDIQGVMVSVWAQGKYYNCSNGSNNTCYRCPGKVELKDEYACHPDEFANTLLSDWQKHLGITLSKEESLS